MRKSDFTLPTLDDLFSTQAERDDAKLERVRNIPLAELHPFKGHPFKVQNNEEMQRMMSSRKNIMLSIIIPTVKGTWGGLLWRRSKRNERHSWIRSIALLADVVLRFAPLGQFKSGKVWLHR